MKLGYQKMRGSYKITLGDEVIEVDNIITNRGREEILNAIANDRRWAQSIAIGVGEVAATVDDTSLGFLTAGEDIQAAIIVPADDRVYFKTSLPEELQFKFSEIGCYGILFSTLVNPREGIGPVVSVFNALTEWISTLGTPVLDTINARVSSEGIAYDIAASETATGYLDINLDLSLVSNTTKIKLAYYCSNMADIILRFKTDDENYFTSDALPVVDGYQVGTIQKSSFTNVGTPSWETIARIEFEFAASASPAYVMLDALRYDTPTDPEENLLSRVVLGSPKEKLAGMTMDIEYAWELG